jgi:hypothetical protein
MNLNMDHIFTDTNNNSNHVNDGVFVKLSANLNNMDFVTIESISHGHFNFPLSETN